MLNSYNNRPRTPVAHESKTISTTALGITAANLVHGSNIDAAYAKVFVETQPIRYSEDGTAPTAAIGIPIAAGGSFEVFGIDALRNLRMIRSGGVDANVQIHTYL